MRCNTLIFYLFVILSVLLIVDFVVCKKDSNTSSDSPEISDKPWIQDARSNSSRKEAGIGGDEGSEENRKNLGVSNTSKENRASSGTGLQRRPANVGSSNGTSQRDSQLLSLLAARRRQLLTERLGAHLATIATFSLRPDKQFFTPAQLEVTELSNSVHRRPNTQDSISQKQTTTTGKPSSKPLFRVEPNIAKLSNSATNVKYVDTKPIPVTKTLQDVKNMRSELLHSRRKSVADGRFSQGTKKPLIDLSVVSHETFGIPERNSDVILMKTDSKEEGDVIFDPDEEFQVDESNHGLYLLNYTSNATQGEDPNHSDVTPVNHVELLNSTFKIVIPNIDDTTDTESQTEVKEKKKPGDREIKKVDDGGLKLNNGSDVINGTKIDAAKIVKTDAQNAENNTLFISDELYKHFRPLESELPDEEMAPFLFFGQKITLSAPNNNVTNANVSPTKPTPFLRSQDKKRGSYRPSTDKILATEGILNHEEEINENMDVSVVKNVIEKNKIRNTVKMQAPSKQVNLVNAYRKLNVTNDVIASTTESSIVIVLPAKSEKENTTSSVKDSFYVIFNATTPNYKSINRTSFNFRRKPAKIVELTTSSTERPVSTSTAATSQIPSTVVYTAVVTSVSVTSSIKGQNKNDSKVFTDYTTDKSNNETIQSPIASKNEYSTTELIGSTASTSANVNIDEENEKKRNETVNTTKYRKKPEVRQRTSTSRPRTRFTAYSTRSSLDSSALPSSTPFILYPNRSSFYPKSRDAIRSTVTPTVKTTTTTENPKLANETNLSISLIGEKILSNASIKDIEKSEVQSRVSIPVTNIRKSNSTAVIDCFRFNNGSSNCNEDNIEKPISSTSIQPETFNNPTTESNIYKIKNTSEQLSTFNNTDETNSYFYVSDSTTNPENMTIKIVGTQTVETTSEKVNIGVFNVTKHPLVSNNASTPSEKDLKEILQRRNGEVYIELEKSNMTTYVLAGLGFLPLTIIIMFVLRHVFFKKTKSIDSDYEGYFQDDIKKEITTVARPPLPTPKKPDSKWEFPRNKLRLQTLLGQGNFGQVWKAEADDLTGHDGLTRLVAVKTIKETATQKEKQELLHEICIMQKIGTHPNVVTLLACCTEQEPYLLIMEYVMCGKLLTYLRDRRSRLDRFQMPRGGLTSRDLTVFAYCVARGMDYLASKGIVHRDLAARNVLVDHNKLCKIADFGMSREVNPSSGAEEKGSKPQRNALPVRWMAPEALLYSVYSHETDVWAYGVLLWEIVTLGSTPYAAMSGREVLHMVTEGYRLERPAHCKPHLYQTMHACWHSDPSQRPPFSDIKKQLSELLENEPTEGNYVDLESFYQDSSVYSDPSAIIENDGGISIEYSAELNTKLRKDELPRRSFHIPITNLQRNFSGGNLALRSTNLRSDGFSNVRSGSHTTVGGFGIMDGGFSGRDGNFCDRNETSTSFHRERETTSSRDGLNVPGSSNVVSRNSFNGVGNQRSGGRSFLNKSGSNRSKRISEFECDI